MQPIHTLENVIINYLDHNFCHQKQGVAGLSLIFQVGG